MSVDVNSGHSADAPFPEEPRGREARGTGPEANRPTREVGRVGPPALSLVPAPVAAPVPKLAHFGVAPMLVALDSVALIATFAFAGPRSAIAGWLLTLAVFARRGLYRSRLSVSLLEHLPVLLAAPLVAGSLAVAHDLFLDVTINHHKRTMMAALGAALALVLVRGVAYTAIRAVRRRGLITHRTLILGAGRVGKDVARALLTRPEHGLRPMAFWDPTPLFDEHQIGLPVLAKTELADAIRATGATVVLVAFGSSPESGMVDIVRTCDRMRCEIFVVPRLFELHHRGAEMDEVWGTPMMRLRRPAFRSPTWRLKRLVDILVSAVLLLPLAPVLAVCALAVRIEGGRGIIFRQQRVGLDGRVFELLKFRSMKPNSDFESATKWSVAADYRVGPVGRLLRRTSLDELPQLINVLRGDMTLVGPRPERPYFVELFTDELPRYVARHRVPAGLTGWAQVHGLRGNTSIAERVRFDNYYIENWSLWLDLKILLRTLSAVVRREGA